MPRAAPASRAAGREPNRALVEIEQVLTADRALIKLEQDEIPFRRDGSDLAAGDLLDLDAAAFGVRVGIDSLLRGTV